MPNFTPEDLLLYDAGELDEIHRNAISEELKINWSLREKMHVLREAASRINAIKLHSPRKQTVQSIIRYAMRKSVTI